MKPCPLLFLGTTDFSAECLKCLLKSSFYQVVGVITRGDRPRSRRGLKKEGTPVKILSQKYQLPLWNLESFKNISPFPVLAVTVDYGRLLPASFLEAFLKGVVNIHPSLLPRWRGAAPIERALMAGDKKTGVCLQLMSEELDAGDIIGKEEFPLAEEDTAEEVYKKVGEISKKLLLKDLLCFLKGKKSPIPQENQPPLYAKKIKKEECEILWRESASSIHNKIRGLNLGPQAFALFKGERLKVYRSQVVTDSYPEFSPGSVVYCARDRLTVACGKGALNLLEVQRPGRKRLPVEEFLKGVALKKGERLEKNHTQ